VAQRKKGRANACDAKQSAHERVKAMVEADRVARGAPPREIVDPDGWFSGLILHGVADQDQAKMGPLYGEYLDLVDSLRYDIPDLREREKKAYTMLVDIVHHREWLEMKKLRMK
jgi:hypothetical protein